MTSVLGLEHDGEVWLGADSAVSGEEIQTISSPKVWVRDGLIWGSAGDIRPGEIIRFCLRTPKPPKKEIEKYVQADLLPAMASSFTQDGMDWDAKGLCIEFLVGVSGELWEIGVDGHSLTAIRPKDGYTYIGAGGAGGLVGLRLASNLSPRNRLLKVLNAMAYYLPTVRGPFTVIKL